MSYPATYSKMTADAQALIREVDEILAGPVTDDTTKRIVEIAAKYRPAVMLSAIISLRGER